MKQSSEANFVGLANQRLVSTLAKNLANLEHFAKQDAVSFILKGIISGFSNGRRVTRDVFTVQLEKLALAVEEQRSGDTRARVSFLVLTHTLLLSLGELKETQHLLTAQRVYLLLEPPLLELIKNSGSQVTPQSFKLTSVYKLDRK